MDKGTWMNEWVKLRNSANSINKIIVCVYVRVCVCVCVCVCVTNTTKLPKG